MSLLRVLSDMLTSLSEGQLKDDKENDPRKRQLSHQKNITIRLILAVVVCCVSLLTGCMYLPDTTGLAAVGDRLGYTFKWQLPIVFVLTMMLGKISLVRFLSDALNPVEGTEQHLVQIDRNVLTNTMEHYLVNFISQLVLTTYLAEGQMKVIPVIVMLFVVARLQYWHGYLDTNMGRSNKSFGYGLTATLTCGMVMYCMYRFCLEMFL